MVYLIVTLVLLVATYFIGRAVENSHFSSMGVRDQQMSDITVSDLRTIPGAASALEGKLVTGATVVASDYFRSFAAGIRNLFGGEVRGLERMVERGRREAMLRMLEEARSMGATAVYNVRIDTSTIAGKRAGSVAFIEVLVSGTAVREA